MLDAYLAERAKADFDFRRHACPEDPLLHLFEEWVDYYRGKYAICRAIAPRSILEIGVRYGYSAITFLEACPGAEYVGLDNDSSSFGGSAGAGDWARRITAGHRARFITADTQRLESLPGEGYDLVHVDGQQDGDGTWHDLELALEKGRWILVDGFFWSRQNLEASTQFLQKYRSLLEYAVILPGYAGDLVIRVRDDAGFARRGAQARTHVAIREDYTREYFLKDCGGHEIFKSGSGRSLVDARLITLFETGKPWAGARVLDVGSGRGELAYACHKAGARVTGIDYSRAAVDIATETYRDALGEGLEFVCRDILEYEPVGQFDRIVAADFVEHIDPGTLDRVFAKLSRWLAPGGRLVIHTWPNRIAYDHQHRLLRRRAAELGLFVPRNQRSLYEDRMHLNEQTPSRLRRSLARHFPGVLVWVGSQEDPAGGLRSPPTRAMLRSRDSIYAMAARESLDARALLGALTQDAIDPADLLDVAVRVEAVPARVPAGARIEVPVALVNASRLRLASLPPYPVNLSYHWVREDGMPEIFDGVRTRLDSPVEPGEGRTITVQVVAPARQGCFNLAVTMVQEGRFWLEDHAPAARAVVPRVEVT